MEDLLFIVQHAITIQCDEFMEATHCSETHATACENMRTCIVTLHIRRELQY
jgi:hypothetical protein